MVHQNIIDEQRNQVRWQSKLGDSPLSPDERAKILDARELTWKEYYKRSTHPEVLETCKYHPLSPSSINFSSSREHHILSEFRPHRPVEPFKNSSTIGLENNLQPKFHLVEFTESKWLHKQDMIEQFRSTVSRIIIKQRMMKRLKKLKQTIISDEKTTLKQATAEKYPYNIGKSIQSIVLSDCGTNLLHHQVWSERNYLLCDQKLTKTNHIPALNSRPIQSIHHSLPITCTYNFYQLSNTFATPKHYWPIFDVPITLEQYEMRYTTDKFDLNTAMDYAKLIPMDINYDELLSIKRQNQQNQLSSTSQVIESPLSGIHGSINDLKPELTVFNDTTNQSIIHLPQCMHSLPKSNMNTDSYSNNQYLPVTFINQSTLNDYFHTLVDSINPFNVCNDSIVCSSLSNNSDYVDTVLINLDQAPNHRILSQWSSSSNMHKPLVPLTKLSYSKYHHIPEDDNILHGNELFSGYSLNENESKSMKELVEQDIQEWTTRFPELNSMCSIENESDDEKSNEKTLTTLNNKNDVNPLLNLNNAPIEESKKYQNEILSVCKFKFCDDE
ncbi:unnamed protein product [Schistosoma turkestanicum]|nr:unnamed protein product [Schistosoma turkestanicum]